MKTTKDIAIDLSNEIISILESPHYVNGEETELIENTLRDFAKLKCKEQRENCKESHNETVHELKESLLIRSYGKLRKSILNAPEPEI